jgi:ribosomal protein S12 methylthiotransferase accessory factor
VDLDAFGDAWLAELREVYGRLRRDVWVLDLTTDLGVPAMAAVSARNDGGAEDIMFGFGAHLDPAIAVRRALTELNQLMPAVVGARDGDYACDDPDALRWWRTGTVASQPYVAPDPATTPRRPADYDYVPCDDIAAEVSAVADTVAAHGMELLVLDQTRPDIGLPVVKVIVPGMRHFWARFAPGRLYDVPVRLGRRAAPVRYADLNPIPMFL